MDNIVKDSIHYFKTRIERFTEHPKAVCMNYITHTLFSLNLAKLHAYGVYVSIVHGVCPFWHTTSVTELNEQITEILKNNGCKKED
jgi:hypothetical protein